ncbi:M14 family zinc carboxypeptidase [Alkalihalobacterium alkalinitrilicum]|uniref:M14 family zinc carboxypeptidase n=1 Tax=Alkalihalobacterium alkalinitrilicum TaxID=427920 RepID=UPI0009956997|nr:M14 family zinc carboxypeptidase [Alkalihalobacterium alkalinitrilicum]
MNFQPVIDNVPDYKEFLTVEEMDKSCWKLAEEYPDIVSVFEAGKSREGHAILCMKIGDGPKDALCFACPHPNEPIGAMTLEYFSRILAENDELREGLGFTWYMIKCIDPDGVRLNEDWFKGPFNLYNYSRNYFRPIGYEQVEWTFPIDYKELHFHKPLPETETLMKLIQDTKPDFMYSLHNAGFGGTYWYLTHDLPELYEELRKVAIKQDIPLNLGEPEEPFITKFSPAIFKNMTIGDAYDFTEKYTGEIPNFKNGTSSSDYASRVTDCVTLLTELPYFFDPRIEDLGEGEMTRKEAIMQNIKQSREHFARLDKILAEVRSYISEQNPFVKLVDEVIQYHKDGSEAKIKWADSNPEFEKRATYAEIFDNLQVSKFYNGLYLGLTVRTLEYEMERFQRQTNREEPVAVKILKDTYEKEEQFLKDYCENLESELNYTWIPIQKLVRIQVESGLLVANYIRENR